MADPLSVFASVITVLATGVACARSLLDIVHDIKDAPGELIALSNEVNDLTCVLDEGGKVCKSLAMNKLATAHFIETFQRLIKEAEAVLGELNSLVLRFKSQSRNIQQSVLWLRQKGRMKARLMRLQAIHTGVSVLLTSTTASVLCLLITILLHAE